MLLNNTGYFFFAVIGLIALLPNAYAQVVGETEHGINYDRTLKSVGNNGELIYQWTSTPDSGNRVRDPFGEYKNYIITEDSGNIYFKSARGNISFNKNTCTLSTYDTDKTKFTLSHSIKKAVNGTDDWYGGVENSLDCNYTLDRHDYSVDITATKGSFEVIYNIDFNKGFEWTYEYTQTNPSDSDKKIGFTFVCDGPDCDDIKLNGREAVVSAYSKQDLIDKNIMIGNMPFDTKDYVHDALWAMKESTDKLVVDFTDSKGPLEYGGIITVDPTFGYSAAQSQQYIQSNSVASTQCESNAAVNGSSGVASYVKTPASGVGDVCLIQVAKWIIDTIPDSATVTSANFRHDRGAVGSSTNERMFVAHNMTTDPQGSGSATTKFVQGTQGNFVISPWTESAAGTNDIVQPFNSNGTTYIQSGLVRNWVGIGISFVNMVRDGSQHRIDNLSGMELQVTYSVIRPNSINTLTGNSTSTTTANLQWTAPNLNGGTLQRYVFNYTTPCGVPNTFLANGTTATNYLVSNLNAATCYSFRVSAATEAGKNITGANIVNVTTTTFNQANYTIGSFNYNADNPLRIPIRYEQVALNSTHTLVNVTYTKSFNLSCDLRYTYAATNRTYHNVAGTVISNTEKEASFRMKNPSNEITTFHCWNDNGNQSANYVMTQSNFLLLQQIQQFRNGTFGTTGQLGAFDLVALIIIIISMIGLNRDNEIVGGIFCLIGISITSYFGIIAWYTGIVAAAAVIIMMMVVSAKKT